MEQQQKKKRSPTQRRYPSELKERAVRMVFEVRAETGLKHGAVQRVAAQLGIGVESLRSWVKQAEIDRGDAWGISTADAARIKDLE